MSKEELENEEDIISEGAEYSPKSEFSKARTVYDSVAKCVDVRGKEMIAGFWNVKVTKQGTPIRTWEADSRKLFIGSVEALRGLLYPERRRSKNMKEFEAKFKEAKKKLWDKYSYAEKLRERVNHGIVWKPTGKTIMPSIGAVVVIPNQDRENVGRKIAEEVVGGWDIYVDAYYDELLIMYDKLFERINSLIDSLNYFKPEVSF